MNLFTIDENKCTKCSICAKECPAQVIQTPAKEKFPAPANEAENFCIKCGHCVSVCPEGAFALNFMNPADCTPVMNNLLPGENSIAEFLKSRRSVRRFSSKTVSHEALADLVDVARYAPTGSNKQQVNWTIFEDSKDVNHLSSLTIDWTKSIADKIPDPATAKRMARLAAGWDSGRDTVLHGSPHVIIVHAQADLPSAHSDCIIALTYLELYAYSKGLGTCFAGYLTTAANSYSPLSEAINLPTGHKCFGAVMIGYPQYKYNLIPERNQSVINWR